MRELAVIFFLTASIHAQGDFRNVNWGMTKEQVKKSEHAQVLNEKPFDLLYRDSLYHKPVIIRYHFSMNILTSAIYLFQKPDQPAEDTSDYYFISDDLVYDLSPDVPPIEADCDFAEFNSIQKELSFQFGQPKFRSIQPHLLSCEWQDKESSILLESTADNYLISMAIFYRSKKYLGD